MDVTVACPCPGTPHPDGDTVTLRDKPTLEMGTTSLGWASQQASDGKPTTGHISVLYVREGILSWTFLEEDGTHKPVNAETLDWFVDDFALAYPVAEKAAELYTDAIFAPLLAQMNKSSAKTARPRRSSQPGPTDPSTSA